MSALENLAFYFVTPSTTEQAVFEAIAVDLEIPLERGRSIDDFDILAVHGISPRISLYRCLSVIVVPVSSRHRRIDTLLAATLLLGTRRTIMAEGRSEK